MSILSSYISSLRQLIQNWKIWLIYYLLHLICIVVVAKPFYARISKKLNYVIEGNNKIEIFDYTFITESLRIHGDIFAYLFSSLTVVILVYVLLKIYLSGATIATFLSTPSVYDSRRFWSLGSRNFWRIFRLSIYFILIYILVGYLFFRIYSIRGLNIFEMETDQVFINRFLIVFPLYILISFVIYTYHQFTKVHIIAYPEKRFFTAFWEASKIISHRFFSMAGLLAVYLVLFMLLYAAYYLFQQIIDYSGAGSLLLALIIGQVFIMARIGFSIFVKVGICSYYKKKILP